MLPVAMLISVINMHSVFMSGIIGGLLGAIVSGISKALGLTGKAAQFVCLFFVLLGVALAQHATNGYTTFGSRSTTGPESSQTESPQFTAATSTPYPQPAATPIATPNATISTPASAATASPHTQHKRQQHKNKDQ